MNVKYTTLVREMKEEFKNFEVIEKDTSKLMKFLYSIALMKFWNPDFMTRYTTTLFGKVYMPYGLIDTTTGYSVLRHERVHLRDAKRFPVLFEISYLLLFPAILTMRAFWEYRAYCESLAVYAELQGSVREYQIDITIDQFTGKYYLWMFPFRKLLKRKFLRFLDENRIKVQFY